MKTILIILDGVSGSPIKKTPLEQANTPYLDLLTKHGKMGYMYPIKENLAPESDTAVLAILGYDPYEYYTGRGPLEAIGSNIKIQPGDLTLRTNFATIENNTIVERRAGRTLTSKEAKILAKTINKKVKLGFPFIFKATSQHRGVLSIKGGFSDNITNTDPAYMKGGIFATAKKSSNKLKASIPLDEDEVTKISANLINSFTEQSHKILKNHKINQIRIKKGLLPANIILSRDAGIKAPNLPKKTEKWLAVLGYPLEKGICKVAGIKILEFKYPKLKKTDIYENLYKGLKAEIKNSKKALKKDFDVLYLHFKETDIPGHDNKPEEKRKMIELLDKEFFSQLINLKNTQICITADHSTPCNLKRHSADPVPVLISGKDSDNTTRFTEKQAKRGSLKKIYGKDLIKLLS